MTAIDLISIPLEMRNSRTAQLKVTTEQNAALETSKELSTFSVQVILDLPTWSFRYGTILDINTVECFLSQLDLHHDVASLVSVSEDLTLSVVNKDLLSVNMVVSPIDLESVNDSRLSHLTTGDFLIHADTLSVARNSVASFLCLFQP